MINAVALSTPEKLQPELEPQPSPEVPPPEPSPAPIASEPQAVNAAPQVVKKLLKAEDHKLALKKPLKKEITKNLLADLQSELSKKKALRQKKIEDVFNQQLKRNSSRDLDKLFQEEKTKTKNSARGSKLKGIVDKYKALILQAIGQQWVVPSNVNKHLSCQLLIRLAPGGLVLDVQVMRTSGNESLDRSARAAVFKASPLPVPTDIYSFEPFRSFVLKVKAENVVDPSGDKGFWIG